jgi:ankyrin repeat protein
MSRKKLIALVLICLPPLLVAWWLSVGVRHLRNLQLDLAASRGDTAAVRRLLSEGAYHDPLPLQMAARKGHTEVVLAILDADARLHPHNPMVDARNALGQTALMVASEAGKLETVKALLERKADPNVKASNKLTALKAAQQNGHGDVVELLRQWGARE